jgi:protein-S-isoprenylcysteine O-methyltransferase Ste14
MFSRISAFIYGVLSYLAFLAVFVYAIGFLGNFVVPKSIDSGREAPFLYALAINAVLLALFALQHSVMARPWFKAAWTRFVPSSVERSTYVLFSSLALLLLFWKWEPMGGVVWNVTSPDGQLALNALYGFGVLIILPRHFSSITSICLGCARSGSIYAASRTRTLTSALPDSTAWSATPSTSDGC